MSSQPLSPYDTGQRLEPHAWVRGQVATPGGLPRQAMPDDFGRVDFDNDEGTTVVTAYVERTGEGYVLHVEATGSTDVELRREEARP